MGTKKLAQIMLILFIVTKICCARKLRPMYVKMVALHEYLQIQKHPFLQYAKVVQVHCFLYSGFLNNLSSAFACGRIV